MSTFRGSGTPSSGDNFPTTADLEAAVAAAEASATAAANSAIAALAAQTGAELAETNAETAETNAETAQTAAETAQTAAELAETNAETAETNAVVAQVAAEAALDEFDDLYLGSKASDPTLDNDGAALQTGALYFNSTNDVLRVYDGSSWGDVGQATANFTEWTATAGQTVFTGNDDNTKLLAYKAGFIMVFHNGSLLDPDDYTATDGSTVTLDAAATLGDILNFVGYGTFDVADTYTKAEADAQYAPISRSNRNLVINGGFNVWQRGTSFPAMASLDFGPDRWRFRTNGAGVLTMSQSTTVPAGHSGHSLHVDVTTADTSIAAGDYYVVDYNIEGYDAAALQWDSTSPKDVTVSFWVRSSKTGVHCLVLKDGAVDTACFVHEYTVDAVDTWQKIVFTVPGATTGTWATDNSSGLYLSWILAMGSDWDATPEVWLAANLYKTTNQVNCMDSAVNTFLLKDVKVEVGAEATDFECRPFAEEVALCYRYYCKTSDYDVYLGGTGIGGVIRISANGTTNRPYVSFRYPTPMRVTPDITPWNVSTGTLDECYNASNPTNYTCTVDVPGHACCTMRVHGGTPASGDAIDFHADADAEL